MTSAVCENTLGATALWTAAVRAKESGRDGALLRDPWAELLAGEGGLAWIAARPPGSTLPILIRTRYFDDFLMRVAAGGIRQVVLLAAGLDTRAYRLAWPAETTVYEIDQAAVIAYKDQVLAAAGAEPACRRRSVAADLTELWQDKLRAAGYTPSEPACFLLEGFLFYLPQEQLERVLDQAMRFCAPGSRLGFDVVNTVALTSPYTKPWLDMQAAAGAPWLGALDDPIGFLSARGWEASLTQGGQPDANYGRWTLPVIPVSLPSAPHNWLVTGTKQAD